MSRAVKSMVVRYVVSISTAPALKRLSWPLWFQIKPCSSSRRSRLPQIQQPQQKCNALTEDYKKPWENDGLVGFQWDLNGILMGLPSGND